MYVNKNFNLKGVLTFSGSHIIWLTVWSTSMTVIYEFTPLTWSIPWLPLSVIGTAVAFYVGFKNNSAYDRLWEARKIWGAIVNDSRAIGSMIKAYISDVFTDADKPQLDQWKQQLIYRHIAWLYTLRNQLLIPTQWEHVNIGKHIGKLNAKRREKWGVGLHENDGFSEEEMKRLLSNDEFNRLKDCKNTATQLIDEQSQSLLALRKKLLIDDFRHMEMQNVLNRFYEHQGKCERIKKFPLPRQYASMSFYFVAIFIFLLPFGMVSEFSKLGELGAWLSIPFTVLIGWVFVMMELIGDYSENPFEGLGNDIPMLSLCRTIEIDMREMLGETDLPPAIEVKNGVLM